MRRQSEESLVSPLGDLSSKVLPPPPPSTHSSLVRAINQQWSDAIKTLNGVTVLKLMLDEMSKIPFREKKRFGTKSDSDIVQIMVQDMLDALNREFLHVDFKATCRGINQSNWNTLTSCRRSDSGTVGTIFLQCGRSDGSAEIIVAKPIVLEDYEKTHLVNVVASTHFGIKCPAVRFISRADAEFEAIEKAVQKLFFPLSEELYNMGGHLSPKDLFSSQGILLLEFVEGKPLCHRTQGQRILTPDDYFSLGKLFFLDLLIRNTDRLPCARAMPRPGSQLISDHGNAGNIMFGEHPGEVWSIDPEMMIPVDDNIEQGYMNAVDAVVREIVLAEASIPCFQSLDVLFFSPAPGLKGILDVSLQDLKAWYCLSPVQTLALSSLLDMIRLRVQVDEEVFLQRTGGLAVPRNSDEKLWRDWMRLAAPRAVTDVMHFLELYTGYAHTDHAEQAFIAGFKESLQAAVTFKKDYELDHANSTQNAPLEEGESFEMHFMMRVIERVSKYTDTEYLKTLYSSFRYNK